MNHIAKSSLSLLALLLTGCRSVDTPIHSSATLAPCDNESIIFTRKEIETRSWLMESGSPAKYNSSKTFHFKNHNDVLAAKYGPGNDSASKCVDFYSDAGTGRYILLVHDSSHLPIESVESVEQKGKVFVEISRWDKQTGDHARYSYQLTDRDILIPTMSYFTWKDKDQ